MRYSIFCLLILVLVVSCKDDDQPTGNASSIEGTHISIDEIKDYIPNQYANEASLVYVDEVGNEKLLQTNYVASQIDRLHNGLGYTTDQFTVTIYDPADQLFQIVVSGSANYTGVDNIVKTLGGALMPFNETGTTSTTIRFENGAPNIVPNPYFKLEERFEVFGKVFNDVFVKTSQQFPDAYSELDINKEVGVVAFRDADNDLWVFDRFVE